MNQMDNANNSMCFINLGRICTPECTAAVGGASGCVFVNAFKKWLENESDIELVPDEFGEENYE